ncbi:unnamed protein product [Ixodes pacificus]
MSSTINETAIVSTVKEGESDVPWPFYRDYFKLVETKENGNIDVRCLKCAPKLKIISASVTSTSNVRKHLMRSHKEARKSVDKSKTNVAGVKRKAAAPKERPECSTGPPQHRIAAVQPSVADYIRSSKSPFGQSTST